jgi:4-amino-4-deoxy-L-arabinose transferase-like glycosyltransferase
MIGNKDNTYAKLESKVTQWTDFFLLLAAFFLLFWGLGNRGLWGSEGRWAQVTSEMLANKDFFHPTIGGEPYFDKPLLTYWLIAAVYAVTGTLNEWVIRLPSAIAGFITIWATVLLGRRLWSVQVGRLAGWLLLTMFGILFWSRTAAADTENLAAVTLCILWYWTRRDKPNFVTFVLFYLIAFLGALTKGLGAVAVPIVAILPDLVFEKRWKVLLKPSHFIALGLGCAVYLSPFIHASATSPQSYHSSGLALVFQENIQRYFAPIDHKNPFYVYVYSVPLLLLPWAPIFIASLAGMVMLWKDLIAKNRWLLSSIIAVFLFFTLSGSRRSYYILPITPLCSLLMTVFLIEIANGRTKIVRDWGLAIQKYFCMALIAIEISLPFILLAFKAYSNREFFMSLGISGIVLGLAAGLVVLFLKRIPLIKRIGMKEIQDVTIWVGITVIVMGGYFCWQNNIMDDYRTEYSFVKQLRTQIDGLSSANIAIFPKHEARLLYYLGQDKHVQSINNAQTWGCFLKDEQKPKVLIMQYRYLSRVPAQYASLFTKEPDVAEAINPWDSSSTRKEKWAAWFLDNGHGTATNISKETGKNAD